MLETDRIFAHFKIIRKLGEGGMGEVYLAEDQKLHRNIALKILQPEFFDQPERLERFRREARTAAKISHPNVMAIYDIGTAVDDRSGKEINYIVMEYISGQSLSEFVKNQKPELKDLLRISQRVASGLAAAHKLGIVHRDIKTDNIMIDESGEPKILDFGLAKPIASAFGNADDRSTQTVSQALTREGKIVGTVTYMSPEQARGEQVDSRSDIFSFGTTLYRMVTGDYPFKGSDPVSTMAKILEARQVPIRQHDESLPAELDRIIDKCLQKDADDRYQDTRDLVVDLRSLRRQYESGVSDTGAYTAEYVTRHKKSKKYWLTWPKLVFLGILSIPLLAIFVSVFDGSDSAVKRELSTVQQEAQPFQGRALAILGFENKTGDSELDWLTAGLPEILLTDLAQHGQRRLISRNRILDCLDDPVKGITDLFTHEECVKAAKSLGAGTVLSGAFFKLGDQLRIDARLEDVETGQIILGEKVVGDDPFALVDSLTEKIALSLHLRDQELAAGQEYLDQDFMLKDPGRFVDSIMKEVSQSLREHGVLAADRGVAKITSSSLVAYKHYILGMEKFNLGLFDKAIDHFQKAIDEDSTFALPYLRIGMSYTFQGRKQQGVPYIAAALRFQDNLPLKERSLLDIYADTWLRTNFDEAFIKLQSYVDNYPDDKEARAIYALYLSQIINDQDAALAQLDTVVVLDPRYPLALEAYAGIYVRQKEYDKAIDYLQRLKKYHPESPTSYETLTGIYRDLGRYDDAMKESQEHLKISPDSYSALVTLIGIYNRQRDFAHAREYLERIREIHGEDPYTMTGYYALAADLADWEGRFMTATDHLFAALAQAKLYGDSTAITGRYQHLGLHYLNIGLPDSALFYSQEATKWASAFQKIDHPIFMVLIDPEQAPAARRIYQKAEVEFKSRVPTEFWSLLDMIAEVFDGYCRADTAAVIAGREKQLTRPDQEFTTTIEELGRLLVLTGQYERGREVLQKLVKGPQQTTAGFYYLRALYYIGIANEALGSTQDAIANYREVLRFWDDPEIEIAEIKDLRQRLGRLTS